MAITATCADVRWVADRDGEEVGRARAVLRPDRRRFLFFAGCAPDAYGPLLREAVRLLDEDLHVQVDEDDSGALDALTGHGFTPHRRENYYELPTDPRRTGLEARAVPDGYEFVSAALADLDRHRELDDALRHDVPGTAGWRNDPQRFVELTLEDPEFDPATYLIAVDLLTDQYVGLVRVWNKPVPALGMVAVLAHHRRRGLAAAMVGRAFAVLHGREQPTVTTDVDSTNTASTTLMTRIGGRRTGGAVELIRPRRDRLGHPHTT